MFTEKKHVGKIVLIPPLLDDSLSAFSDQNLQSTPNSPED
jgi:hypothetical protein